MAFKQQVLIVANLTAASDELGASLAERAERGPTAFTLIVPATHADGGREAAQRRLTEALERLRGAGLEVDGMVGDPDPFVAISEVWNPAQYDAIILSTLPIGVSRWLHAGLPERIFRLTDVPVTHIVAQPPKQPVPTEHIEPQREDALLGPATVLGGGGRYERVHPHHSPK
jgi:nucleotide-binding universal stress UspA family protein